MFPWFRFWTYCKSSKWIDNCRGVQLAYPSSWPHSTDGIGNASQYDLGCFKSLCISRRNHMIHTNFTVQESTGSMFLSDLDALSKSKTILLESTLALHKTVQLTRPAGHWSMAISGTDWLEVATTLKAYFLGLYKGICPTSSMALYD